MKVTHNYLWVGQLLLLIGQFCCLPHIPVASGAESAIRKEDLRLLTTVGQVRGLLPEEAVRGYPVSLKVTATYVAERGAFIQDETGAIYVRWKDNNTPWKPGQKLTWEGVTFTDNLSVSLQEVRSKILGQGPMPVARAMTLDQLATGTANCEWVEVRGVIRSMTATKNQPVKLVLAAGNNRLPVLLRDVPLEKASAWVDAQVLLRGVAGSFFNPQRQFAACQLLVRGTADVRVEKPAPPDPFAIPLRPLRGLWQLIPYGTHEHRVKVSGIVTFQQPGQFMFLQHSNQGVLVQTHQQMPLLPGDEVEAVGFPVAGGYTPQLEDAIYRKTGAQLPPPPIVASATRLLTGSFDSVLVELEAHLLEIVPGRSETMLVLQDSNLVFNAALDDASAAKYNEWPRKGSRLRVTGICEINELNDRVSLLQPKSFRLLLRSPRDILVLQAPSWWTAERLFKAVGVLSLLVLGVLLWVWTLHRRVQEQSTVIRRQARREAALEERARLAREIHDTLAQGFSALGFQLEAIAGELGHAAVKPREQLAVAARMVRHNQEEVRRYLIHLRLPALEEKSLASALPEVAQSLVANSGLQLECSVQGQILRLSETVESNLLRIAQEAITNAMRHAKAKQVKLTLRYEPSSLLLRVADDGCGFDPTQPLSPVTGHFGRQGMRERAEQIGARFTLRSQPGAGTDIIIEVPIPDGTLETTSKAPASTTVL